MGSNLHAGRELDALIAKHVLGLEVIDNVEGYWYCPTCGEWVHGQQVTYTEQHTRCGATVVGDWPCDSGGNIHPAYSTDWGAFGELVAAMKVKGYDITIDTYYREGWPDPAHVGWFINRTVEPTDADAPTVPHAGCLAALTAVGYKEG